MKKHLLIAAIAVFSLFVINSIFQNSSSRNTKKYSGRVLNIEEGGIKDAVFKIGNSKNTFYINRGFEASNAIELKTLIGKTVTIYYSDCWTILDPFNNGSKNIEKLAVNNAVIFNTN
ncbi:MAG: hypothetical protein RLZZ512_1544 [Bacteroidota bacterium]|jgi:hypothetical protein